MRVVTIVSLGASAVLGLGALAVAKYVLPNQAAKAANAPAAQVEGVAVVVAAKDMKYGDKVDAQSLRLIHLPREAAPEGAFTTVAAVLAADQGGPPVVLTPIAAREPLLPSKLSGPGARRSVAAEIAEGMRAYTIKVTDVSGVGGHALPGDRVDVVLLRDLTPRGEVRNWVSEVVLQDVRVLAVDLNADPASEKPATPNTATLEVSVADSQKLAVAADLGTLSLALRRTGAAETAVTTPIRPAAFLSGVAAPAQPGARPVRRAPASGGGIVIIEGERRSGSRAAPPAPPTAPAAAPATTALALG